MLRSRNRVRTLNTGVNLTVTHALGVVPNYVSIAPLSARCRNGTYVPQAPGILTNVVTIVNSVFSCATVDVFCWAYQGRLY